MFFLKQSIYVYMHGTYTFYIYRKKQKLILSCRGMGLGIWTVSRDRGTH